MYLSHLHPPYKYGAQGSKLLRRKSPYVHVSVLYLAANPPFLSFFRWFRLTKRQFEESKRILEIIWKIFGKGFGNDFFSCLDFSYKELRAVHMLPSNNPVRWGRLSDTEGG